MSDDEKSPVSSPAPSQQLGPLLNFPTFKFVPKETQSVPTEAIIDSEPIEKPNKAFEPLVEYIASAKEHVTPRIKLPQATKQIPIEHHKKPHYGCEICGRPPNLMCSACKETYYW